MRDGAERRSARSRSGEVRIVDKASGRLVGLFRQGLATETFRATIAGILDEQTEYEVSAYVDLNNDGKYAPADPSYKLEFTSTSSGAALELDLGSARLRLIPESTHDGGKRSGGCLAGRAEGHYILESWPLLLRLLRPPLPGRCSGVR